MYEEGDLFGGPGEVLYVTSSEFVPVFLRILNATLELKV
jgi:hypothetical protein